MGIGHHYLTGDYVTFPKVRFPAWLGDDVASEIFRLGPDFTFGLYGRQAYRRAFENLDSLPLVRPPYRGRVIGIVGPRSILKTAQGIARQVHESRPDAFAHFTRSAFCMLLAESVNWPARPREPVKRVGKFKAPNWIADALIAHLIHAGEPNFGYFLREALWYAVAYPSKLPALPDEPAKAELAELALPNSLRKKVFRLSSDPVEFALRAAMRRLQLFGALPAPPEKQLIKKP